MDRHNILEKVAAVKKKRNKKYKGPKDVYAPDMSGLGKKKAPKKPAAKPAAPKKSPPAVVKKPKATPKASKAVKSVKPKFRPKKLGMIAAGAAGAGILAAKIRAARAKENV